MFVKAFPFFRVEMSVLGGMDAVFRSCRRGKENAPQALWLAGSGAVGGIRTLGRLLAVTRFPVVLVMTTSIPLRISMLNSKHHYTKIGREVNTQFSLFRKKETERRSVSSLFAFTLTARARRASGSSRRPPSPAAAPPPAGGTERRGCCCPSGRRRRGRSHPRSS